MRGPGRGTGQGGKKKIPACPEANTTYNPRIRVLFNAKGYSNENITLDWLKTDLIPASSNPTKPHFIALDVFAGQKTPTVLNAFRSSKTVTSFIPEGCRSLVQPLDTAINKIFKDYISELLDREMERNSTLWETRHFTVSDRRILMTWIVGEAWDWFHREKSKLIVKAFQQVGITLPIDGSQDSELRIKGLKGLEIGDWREGGLDCNLDKKGKTCAGKLNWEDGKNVLSPEAIKATMEELEALETGGEGEYVDMSEVVDLS